ncbi:MAG: DUF929 family protein [Thermoplasmata archaeon]
MVDWERVEQLRTEGWDWDRIANDSRVGYQAPPGLSDRGRALRSLYVRRARASSRDGTLEKVKPSQRTNQKPKWTLVRVGMLLTPLFAIWFLVAYFIPSPVGVFISAVPTLGLALAASTFLLAFGLLRSQKRWSSVLRGAVASGIILGLALSATFGIGGLLVGYPPLTPFTTSEPNYFEKAANPLWTSGGKPVYFFFGSAACPFCSASSWAMVVALNQFGTLTGTSYAYSSPTDQAGPNTPETVLANARLASPYIALQVAESTYTASIQLPGFANEYQNAYYAAYDSAGYIPFVVVGGQYFTWHSLVDPAALAGMTAAEVQEQINAHSGTCWVAISPAADWLTAYLLKVDGGQPASLLTGTVLTDYDQIS